MTEGQAPHQPRDGWHWRSRQCMPHQSSRNDRKRSAPGFAGGPGCAILAPRRKNPPAKPGAEGSIARPCVGQKSLDDLLGLLLDLIVIFPRGGFLSRLACVTVG